MPRAGVYWGMDRRLLRRIVEGLLVVAGSSMLWVAPETLLGALTLFAGLALEAIGLRLDHA